MQMFSPFLCRLAILYHFLSISAAQNGWVYPVPGKTPDPTYNNIDTLNASWTSNYVTPQLILWCSADGYKSWSNEFNKTVPQVGNRLIPLNFSDTTPFGCHFNLASAKGDANMNSPGFNIQVEGGNAKPVTWSNTTEATTTTTTSATASTSSMTSTLTHTATPTPSPNTSKSKSGSGLGGGAIAGIVVGVIAAIFLPAAALLLLLRSRKKRQQQRARSETAVQKDSKPISELADAENAPVEKDGTTMQAEVEGGQPLVADHSNAVVGELEGSGPRGEGGGGGSVGEAR